MNSSEKESEVKNIFNQEFGFKTGNPFGAFSSDTTPENNSITPIKRINGYDSAMLNKANFDNAETQDLSIDFRVREKEDLIKDLDEKIKQAETYGTSNEALGLRAKRQRILQELSTLRQQQVYGGSRFRKNNFSHDHIRYKMPLLYKINRFVSRYILARISKKVKSVVTLSDSLEQLSDISKSVDELIDMNVPYGEKIQNYEKLTAYLSRANTIHSQIAKTLRQ